MRRDDKRNARDEERPLMIIIFLRPSQSARTTATSEEPCLPPSTAATIIDVCSTTENRLPQIQQAGSEDTTSIP